jgi:hypothetical protein
MADFVKWGYAVAEAASWGGNRFLAAYERNINRQHEEAVSANLLAQAVLEFMANRNEWLGSASHLNAQLDPIAKEHLSIDPTDRRSGWPQDAPRLSKELFRLAETLAASGVEVSRPQRSGRGGRLLQLRLVPDSTGTTDTTVTGDSESGDGSGDGKTPHDGEVFATDTQDQIGNDSGDSGDGTVGNGEGRQFSL